MRVNLSKFFILLFCLFFLPSMCFLIGKQFIAFFIPLLLLISGIIVLLKPMELLKKITVLIRKTPFKYLSLFAIWSVLTVIAAVLNHRFFIGGFITSYIGGLIFSVLLPILITVFLVPKYVSFKTVMRFIVIFCYFVFALAIIEFFVFSLDISFLKSILTIFSNKRMLVFGSGEMEILRGVAFGLPRVRSVFEEPSYLGYFILLMSPIIYQLAFSRYKIFKKPLLNKITKTTIIPFMWISLTLTQSPIFFAFNVLFSIFYFNKYKPYLTLIKKYYFALIFLVCFGFLITLFYDFNIDIKETFLNRIVTTFQNLGSIERFIQEEQSLGTRIIIYVNAFIMFFKNMVFGVGYGNMSYLIGFQLMESPIPLTIELQRFIAWGLTNPASSIFIKTLTETGFIGCFLFYFFIYKLYFSFIKITQYFNKIKLEFIIGLSYFIMNYALASFYDSNLNQPYIWFLMGLVLSFTIRASQKESKRITDKKSI